MSLSPLPSTRWGWRGCLDREDTAVLGKWHFMFCFKTVRRTTRVLLTMRPRPNVERGKISMHTKIICSCQVSCPVPEEHPILCAEGKAPSSDQEERTRHGRTRSLFEPLPASMDGHMRPRLSSD